MQRVQICPHCGKDVPLHDHPHPTVDIVIACAGRGVVLVERRFAPLGWALPGGFVDYGETVESAAIREAKEETSLRVVLKGLLGVYSAPDRDPRLHTISTVFMATTDEPEALRGADDAAQARFFPLDALPQMLAFDHSRILKDFARTHAARFGV